MKPTLQALTGTRSDRVGWFGPTDLENGCPTLARLARLQRGVAAAINAEGRWRETLTVPASSMLSCYGAGGRYRKHTDNSRGADGVCVLDARVWREVAHFAGLAPLTALAFHGESKLFAGDADGRLYALDVWKAPPRSWE